VIIGIPKEIKDGERRVALTPNAVSRLVIAGHTLRVQTQAGEGAGYYDAEYFAAGAQIVANAVQAFDADLVIKVKEIQTEEWRHLRSGGTLFSFLHLGADLQMARELLNRRITGIAFETVGDKHGRLPILAPMSVMAGEMAISVAANLLLASNGGQHSGKGLLMRDAKVLVVGAGNAGLAAAHAANMLGAKVCVAARSERPADLHVEVEYMHANREAVSQRAREADVVIGAINTPGKPTEKILTRANIAAMQAKSVLIEICIDGGGIAETSRPTYHSDPTYVEEGVLHFCVANMPAAEPRSASNALSGAVLPYALSLANIGLLNALRNNDGLARGVQMHNGKVTNAAVAAALGVLHLDLEAVLFAC
jgi:alanine dehydrogenase